MKKSQHCSYGAINSIAGNQGLRMPRNDSQDTVYKMYRDIVKEENSLIIDRQTIFATLTGFLWTAIGIIFTNLNGSKSKSLLGLGYILVVSATGLLISMRSWLSIRDARTAVLDAMHDWVDTIDPGTNLSISNGFIGPGVVGYKGTSVGPWWRITLMAIFSGSWLLVLIIDIVLLVLVGTNDVNFG